MRLKICTFVSNKKKNVVEYILKNFKHTHIVIMVR